MKLQNVEIKNFKGINSLAFNPKKVNVAIGENGKGKTTLMEALRYAITGKYPDDCIAIGCNECKISANVNGDDIIIGRKKGKNEETGVFKLEGKTTSFSSYRASCETRGIARQIDAASFATSNELMSMDVDTLTDFMLNNTPVSISFQKLLSLEPAITEDIEDELANILPQENITLNDITEADVFFTAQRQSIKKSVADAKAKAVYLGEIPDGTETEEQLQKQYEANLGTIAAKKAKADTYRNYVKIIESSNQIKLSIKEKGNQAQALKCDKPDSSKLQQVIDNIEKTRKNINDYKSILVTLNKDMDLFNKTLESLNSNVCPISEKLVCKTDKTTIKTDLIEAINTNSSQITNIQTSIANMDVKISKLEIEKKSLEDSSKQYERYIECLKNIESLRKSIPNIPEKIEEDTTDVSKLELDNRILKQKIENVKKYKEFKILEQQYLNLCKKRDLYECICKLLDEKGSLRDKILTFALTPFEDYANRRAKELGICFNIKILAEKGVRILYNPKGGQDYISYNNASTGEKLMIVFLILDMINALSDMRLLFLDNLDKLDKDALEKLVSLINTPEVQDSYDHIFMVGVDHEDSVNTLKKLTNAQFISF